MLSKEVATIFAKTKLAPTIVKDIVPADGFGSTALVSQSKLLEAAGTNIFTFNFVDVYGTNPDELVVWNSFLDGKMDVPTFTRRCRRSPTRSVKRLLGDQGRSEMTDSTVASSGRRAARGGRYRGRSSQLRAGLPRASVSRST